MKIRLILLAIFAVAFGICATANAQIVQPQYTRPSKGKALQVFNSPVTAASTFAAESAVFDWSAFSGVSFALDRGATLVSECERGLRVSVFGGSSTNKADFKRLDAKNGYYNAISDSAWYTPVLTPYIYLRFEKWTTGGIATCSSPVTVTMTPIPFDVPNSGSTTTWIAGLYNKTSPSTQTIQSSGVTPRLRIVNHGTSVIKCGFPDVEGNTPSPMFYPILLSAGAALDDGTGGFVDFFEFSGKIICTAKDDATAYRIAYYAY